MTTASEYATITGDVSIWFISLMLLLYGVPLAGALLGLVLIKKGKQKIGIPLTLFFVAFLGAVIGSVIYNGFRYGF